MRDIVERCKRLRGNVGAWAAFRTAIVAIAFAFISTVLAFSIGDLRALLAFVLGLALPGMLREQLVARLTQTVAILRGVAIALFVIALAGGALRGRLWAQGGSAEAWLFTALTALVAGYVSAFFWTLSDRRVVRKKSAPDGLDAEP